MDCKSESASHYAGCPCHEERWRERLAAAESRLSACLAEMDKLKGALETAYRALYSERERIVAAERSKVAAESRAERLAEALREIASACECGFPRCQSNVARAALAEHRDAKGKEAGR